MLVDVETPARRRFEHHVVRLQRVAAAVVLDGLDRMLMMPDLHIRTLRHGQHI